jgi:hypothetical protein
MNRLTRNLAFYLSILLFSVGQLVAQPLSGSYSINSALLTGGTNFQSLNAFATALSANGVSGNVTATITSGSGPYTEKVIFQNITGLGASATITLEGNGEIVNDTTDATNRYIIRLSNLSHFTINNLKIVREPSSASGFLGIHIFGTGSHITISNCEVDMSGATSTLVGAYIASGSETSILTTGNFHNLTFNNNKSEGGGYGVSVFGLISPLATNIIISNNEINNAASNGIYLRETDGAQVFGNSFDKNHIAVSGANFIQLAQAANINAQIYNNIIRVNQTANGTLTIRGIYLFNGTGHKVYNNIIQEVKLTSGNFTAIEVRTGATAPEISFNTISLDHTLQTTGNLYGIKEELSNTNAMLRNNLISITQPTTGAKAALALASTSTVTTAFNSNYNLLYAPGGNVAVRNTTTPTLYPTLMDWQGASTQDAMSVSLNPMFVVDTFVMPTNPAANNLAVPIAYVTTDFLGAPRAVVPDIGAYEFLNCVPPVFGPISGPVEVCENTGGHVFSVPALSGIVSYNWTVPSGASITAGTGTNSITVNFSTSGGNVALSVDSSGCLSAPITSAISVSSTPNVSLVLAEDTVCNNSGIITLSGGLPSGGTYTGAGVSGGTFNPIVAGNGLHIITYTYINTAGCSDSAFSIIVVANSPAVSLALPVDTVCLSSGAFALSGGLPSGGTYSGTGVSGGSFDPAQAGSGLHTITYSYTNSAGCSNSASSTIFVDPCIGLEEWSANNQMLIYPNPVRETATILLPKGTVNLHVFDAFGKRVMLFNNLSSDTISFDRKSISSGIYWIMAEGSDGKWLDAEKIIIE